MKDTTTETNTYLVVKTKDMNGYFSPEGYSKFDERWKKFNPEGGKTTLDIYGYEQALEHIQELRESVYEGEKTYENSQFQIQTITTITTTINV